MAFLGSPSCCVVVIPSCSLSSRLLQKKIHTLPLPLHHYTKRNRPDYFSNANASPSPSPRKFVKCLSQKKQSQAESAEAATQFQFERLFSNLNQATLKREPGVAPSLGISLFGFS
jgi:tyrosine-specific transport protein